MHDIDIRTFGKTTMSSAGITSPTRMNSQSRLPINRSKKVGNIISLFEKKKEDEQINALIIDKLKSDARERKQLGLVTPRVGATPRPTVVEQPSPESDEALTHRVQDIRKKFELFQKAQEEKKTPKETPQPQPVLSPTSKHEVSFQRVLSVDGNKSDETMSVQTHSTTTGSSSSVSDKKTTSSYHEEEEQEFNAELFNHWYDNIMCSPPPALIQGLFGDEKVEQHDEDENEDVRWSRPPPASARKKYKIGELDLLNAYKRKSIIYSQNHPDEVRVNPFFFNSSVHLNPQNGDHEDPQAQGWEDDYESDEEMNDDYDDQPKMKMMIGSFDNDETFLKWEREMEERTIQVHLR